MGQPGAKATFARGRFPAAQPEHLIDVKRRKVENETRNCFLDSSQHSATA
jgi:hypothetical protein